MNDRNGVLTVDEAPGGARVTWAADVLPDALAGQFGPEMAQGLALMKSHLDRTAEPS